MNIESRILRLGLQALYSTLSDAMEDHNSGQAPISIIVWMTSNMAVLFVTNLL